MKNPARTLPAVLALALLPLIPATSAQAADAAPSHTPAPHSIQAPATPANFCSFFPVFSRCKPMKR